MHEHVLLPVDPDNEDSWTQVLPKALSIAAQSGACLTIMCVVPTLGIMVAQAAQATPCTEGNAGTRVRTIMQTAMECLDNFARDHMPDSQPATTIVRSGAVHREIPDVAESRGCDLIMIGSDRPYLRDHLPGPNAAMVVRHAGCSVPVVRN